MMPYGDKKTKSEKVAAEAIHAQAVTKIELGQGINPGEMETR